MGRRRKDHQGDALTLPPHRQDGAPDGGWILYLLECTDGSLYAGITTDLERRFVEHQAGKGARYTRSHPPLRVLATARFADRSSASRAEAQLKRLRKEQKPGFFSP